MLYSIILRPKIFNIYRSTDIVSKVKLIIKNNIFWSFRHIKNVLQEKVIRQIKWNFFVFCSIFNFWFTRGHPVKYGNLQILILTLLSTKFNSKQFNVHISFFKLKTGLNLLIKKELWERKIYKIMKLWNYVEELVY